MAKPMLDLESLAEELLRLLHELGFRSDDLADRELEGALDTLTVTEELPEERPGPADPGQWVRDLARIESTCSEALRVAWLVDGRKTQLEVDELEAALGNRSGSTLGIHLFVDKAALLARIGPIPDRLRVCLFLFPRSLALAFRQPLTEIEGAWGLFGLLEQEKADEVDAPLRKVILLQAGVDIFLDGIYLSVAGACSAADWTRFLSTPAPERGAVETVRKGALNLNQICLEPRSLTPLALDVAPQAGTAIDEEAGALARSIFERLLDLCLVFTAGQTRPYGEIGEGKDDWTAFYRVGDSEVSVRFGRDAIGPAERVSASDFATGVATLASIVRRVYGKEDEVAERLKNFEGVMASRLQGRSAVIAYLEIASRAAEIDRHEQWSWETFREGKLKRFFGRVREVMAMVDETKKQHRNEVQDLIRSLVTNVLAGVGVVVGAFAAEVLSDKFDLQLFVFTTRVYAVYLIFFPGCLGLGGTHWQFRQLQGSLEKRKKLFGERLFEPAVSELLQEAESSHRSLGKWLGLAAGVYLLLALLLWCAGTLLPHHFGLA